MVKWQREQQSRAGNAANELFEEDWKQSLCKWAENILLRRDEMLSSLPFTFYPEGNLTSSAGQPFFCLSVCVCSWGFFHHRSHKCTRSLTLSTERSLDQTLVCVLHVRRQVSNCFQLAYMQRLAAWAAGSRCRSSLLASDQYSQFNTQSLTHSAAFYSCTLCVVTSHLSPSLFLISFPCRRISWSAWLSVMSWRLKWTERAMKSMKVKSPSLLRPTLNVSLFAQGVCVDC